MSEKSTPVEPVEPAPPVEPVEPAPPVEPVDPAPPVEPVDPAPPVEPVDPAPPVEPVEPAPPVEPVDPVPPMTTIPAAYLEEVKGRLFRALVAADGRLADPDSLPYDGELLDEPAARAAAIGALLEKNPRLGRHGVSGDVGAGNRGNTPPPPADLIQIIRKAQGR